MVRLPILLSALAVVAACARDREADLRARLDEMFYVGPTRHFVSQRYCTGAAFRVRVPLPRPEIEVDQAADTAELSLRRTGLAAIRVEGASPHELVEQFLTMNTSEVGRQALASAAQAGDCFGDADFADELAEALTLPGALLLYDGVSDGIVVLDHRYYRLFYVAGDPLRFGF